MEMRNLISFEEAKKKAHDYDAVLNECAEYSDAWFFYLNDGQTREGGPHSGIVILKSGGGMLKSYEYFMSDKYEAIDLEKVTKLVWVDEEQA